MGVRIPTQSIGWCLGACLGLSLSPALAERSGQADIQQRAAAEYHQRRVQSFIEDTYRFYEITGEMVSFRVHPNMTAAELEQIEELSEDLDDQAGRLVSFLIYLVPRVRGRTDDLWVLPPLAEDSSLEYRLTVMLSLVNSVEPKIQHLTELLTGETKLSVEVDELAVEGTLPYFIVGGLEELRSMTRELRESL
jgi:hypothetical protein